MTPSWYRKLEIAGAFLFFSLWILGLIQVYFHFANSSDVAILVAYLIAGILVADFMSGLVHWFADTWGSPDWHIVGPTLIRTFREHHKDPASITRHDFIETNGSLLILSSIALSLGIFSVSENSMAFLFSLTSFVSVTNQIHKMAHLPHPPKIFKFLSFFGLVLSTKHHRHHHDGDQTKAYCITLGLWNPLLDRLNFFRRLENLIFAITKVPPRAEP